MRFSCDTGGTFTDLVVEDDGGRIRLYKTSTTPEDPIEGVIAALELAAADQGQDLKQLLRRSDVFIHGTTRAINAILTGATARTALLVTEGHPDILVFREGGRIEPFNFTVPFPEPYVPRALTFEVPERIDASGQILKSLDEDAVLAIIGKLSAKGVAAVAVCLLWSIANARHERRIGQLLNQHLPHVPFTLSHELNPTLREYRRASAAAIDASLKPLMGDYLRGLKQRLVALGFGGRVLVVTSQGGVMDADEVANAPIHSVNSGPAMAPVAGRYFARIDAEREIAIVADTGGTSYDVSLVRRGRIPWTRETWLGQPFRGHMTGFASVDLKSIGAGGGSIAWIDPGGLLHVGPQSAGSIPGPACYGQGGKHATVTDCALLLGYIDPNFFLGGAMPLYEDAARQSVEVNVAFRLGVDLDEAAAAVLSLATENMVGAIEEITIDQGIDPATAVLVGGGGAAGLNCVPIARRLGCSRVIIPEIGAGLSAAGGLLSDLSVEFSQVMFSQSSAFKYEAVNNLLGDLERKCSDFIAGPGRGSTEQSIEFSVEARYPHQIWEIEVPLRKSRIEGAADLAQLISAFHAAHREVFAIEDRESEIEAVLWRARVRCRLNENDLGRVVSNAGAIPGDRQRMVYFPGVGRAVATVRSFESLNSDEMVSGPAIVESPFTTIVVDPGAQAQRTASGSLSIFL
jgi:N-methylhydantoinase A